MRRRACTRPHLIVQLGCHKLRALRHTFATLALSSKAYSLRELQEALGHAQLSSTGRYIKMTDDDLARAAAAHPLAR